MLTKKVKSRVYFLGLLLFSVVISLFLILKTLNKNILYFKTPSDIKFETVNINNKIRIGGMVKKDSLVIKSDEIKFIVTDFKNELIVSYKGTVPNLFSEGKGVVAEGKLNDDSFFIADRILAKHDEKYMPPELQDLLKENVK